MAEATETNEEEVAVEEKTDGRFKMVIHAETNEEVKRVDYIRELADPSGEYGWTRREIADHLTEITGEDVRYQIVFAATKEMEVKKAQRGKPKAEEPDEPEEDNDIDPEEG